MSDAFPCSNCGHSVDHHTMSQLAVNEDRRIEYLYYCAAGRFSVKCNCLTFSPPKEIQTGPSFWS